MIETSWANHYKIGYNNEWFTFRTTPQDRLDIFTDGCGRKPMSLAEEAVNTAAILTERYGQDEICLFYSGGADSEIVLQAFRGLGKIPGRIIFLDYGSNEYDKHFATLFCRYHKLPLEIIPLDAEEMLRSGESIEVCARYQCAQTGLSFYLKAMETLCKTNYVITGDEPYFENLYNPLTNEKKWFFFAREPFYSLWKVFIKNNVPGCPNFLQYTPECWVSYIDDPIMKWLRTGQTKLETSSQVKADVYRHRFFLQPRFKSTGMEKFGPLIFKQNELLMEQHPDLTMQELKYPLEKLYFELTRFIK